MKKRKITIDQAMVSI